MLVLTEIIPTATYTHNKQYWESLHALKILSGLQVDHIGLIKYAYAVFYLHTAWLVYAGLWTYTQGLDLTSKWASAKLYLLFHRYWCT